MLTVHAQPDQRRHLAYPPTTDLHSSPLSFTTTQHYLDSLSHTSPSDTEKILRNYYLTAANLDTFNNLNQSTLDTDPVANNALMTSAYDFQGPAIRVQQSTPIPQLPQNYPQQPSMLAATGNRGVWDAYGGSALGANNSSLQAQYNKQQRSNSQLHQRALSSSSSASSQYPSHTTTAAPFTFSGISDHSPPASSVNKVDSSYSADQATGTFANHLPTPSQTPTSDSFLSPSFQTFAQQGAGYDNTMAAHMAMKQVMMDPDDEVPGYTHSSRQSVSSYGNNSPATPRTVVGDDFDDKFKSNDMMSDMKLEGSTPDSFQFSFNQASAPRLQTQTGSQPSKSSLLSPYRNIMADRLQAANMARSQSPTSSVSRGVSPFRNGSPMAAVNNSFGSPRQRYGGPQMRDQTTDAAVKAFALKNHSTQNQGPEPKTISPKDALLEYNENEDDSKMPLFPPEDSSKYGQQFTTTTYDGLPSNFDTSSEQSFGSMATSRPESWTDSRQFGPSYTTSAPQQSNFNFAPPSIPGSLPVSNGMAFGSSQYRRTPIQLRQEPTPDFPAHLTSMESSASDNVPCDSNGHSSSGELSKPGPSAANTGTYSCTYHGCPLRFESPQKLQKHKREGHRQAPANVTTGIGSGMSQDELLARNSQAGPHKCERINPTTGKPCNTVFSRPYDLTRHEDTIHNARKQKVRCAMCVEEKTFSRNDALTRHMRVVHPEVDFPGKHRRRGQGSHE